MSRRRKRHWSRATKLPEGAVNALDSAVRNKMNNREYVLNPFKIDVETHLYRPALTREQWAAYEMLKQEPAAKKALAHGASAAKIIIGLDGRQYEISASFPVQEGREIERPRLDTPLNRIHPKAREYVLKWLVRRNELRWQTEKVMDTCELITRTCGTWKQIAFLWPHLNAFMAGPQKDIAASRKVKPRIPLALYDMHGKLDERLAPDNMEQCQMWLAEAALLPKYDPEVHCLIPSVNSI